MPRPVLKNFIDFDQADNKRRVQQFIGILKGQYEVAIEPRRNLRTLAQNRLWWSQVVQPFFEFLHDQDYDINDPEQAHSLLKEKFLRVSVADKRTGEVLGWRTRSTTELTVEEFTGLIDSASAWLADQFGILILEGTI